VIPNEVTEKKKIEVKMPAACKNKREAKKYCICQSIYTDGELMLFCEGGCENWYHPKCVGITEDDAKRMGSNPNEKWICSKCQPNMKLKRKKKL
jgi:COMPASS component SPP1